MSIIDDVCVAQGQAPGLLHCLALLMIPIRHYDISAPMALIYWKYCCWFLHCNILYATCLSSIIYCIFVLFFYQLALFKVQFIILFRRCSTVPVHISSITHILYVTQI